MMPYNRGFKLPELVKELIQIRDKLRKHYNKNGLKLKFTPDGRMVGDIGEAIAVEKFGLELTQGTGIDGKARDGRTVQVKASGTNGGAAFRSIDALQHAEHLLFFHLDYENCRGEVIYNGPEKQVRNLIEGKKGQRTVSAKQLRSMDENVKDDKRLKRIDPQ
jgi:hypothetical protein